MSHPSRTVFLIISFHRPYVLLYFLSFFVYSLTIQQSKRPFDIHSSPLGIFQYQGYHGTFTDSYANTTLRHSQKRHSHPPRSRIWSTGSQCACDDHCVKVVVKKLTQWENISPHLFECNDEKSFQSLFRLNNPDNKRVWDHRHNILTQIRFYTWIDYLSILKYKACLDHTMTFVLTKMYVIDISGKGNYQLGIVVLRLIFIP